LKSLNTKDSKEEHKGLKGKAFRDDLRNLRANHFIISRRSRWLAQKNLINWSQVRFTRSLLGCRQLKQPAELPLFPLCLIFKLLTHN